VRFSRSIAPGVLGVVALILLIGAGMNACDDKLSRQLDNVDPSNEEMVQNLEGVKK
jgi:hypothetical protein